MAENPTTSPESLESGSNTPRRRRWLGILAFLLPLAGLLWVSNWFYQRSRLFTGSAVVLGEPALPWGMLIGEENAREIFGQPVEFTPYQRKLSSSQIGLVSGYTPLTSLSLRGVTDADVLRLNDLVNLKLLTLDDSPLTDAACKVIGQFDQLEYLGIQNYDRTTPAHITSEGLQHLVGLNRLSGLFLQVPEVTDEGLQHIAQLTAITNLTLVDAQIHGEGLRELSQLQNMTMLHLQNCPLAGNCLSHLSDCLILQHLSLDDSTVTDEMLQDLILMPSLRSVYLARTNVTAAGCQRFHEARPDVQITDANDRRFPPSPQADK